MRQLGIVDLGSSNARMVVYAHQPERWFRLVDVIREPVRLGEGLGATGELTRAAIARGIDALDLFADYAAAAGLDALEVIGTSALRDAANREVFLAAARRLGAEVRVLSGDEEAATGVLAVANGFDLPGAWVVDLGGGSLQVSRMRNRLPAGGGAHPLGTVRLTEAFFSSDPPKRAEVRALEAEVARHLAPVAAALRADPVPLVAMGGTIRNLARTVQKKRAYPLDLLHGYYVAREDLEAILDRLLTLSRKKRARIPGINSDRADVILGGALAYRWLLREGRRDGLFVSGHGVREGTFYRHFLPPPHLVPDVRAFSVANLTARYELDSRHTGHVRKLARRLFEDLRPLHGLGPREEQLLDAAAALHDLGVAVGFYRHHHHGAYVLGSEPLAGFTHREQALLMLLVRFHHKGVPRLDPYQSLAAPGDGPLLAHLAACLRLAEYLERSRAGRVRDLSAEIADGHVTLTLEAGEQPAVELWETAKQASVFERAYGRKLVLRAAVG